MKIFNIHHCAKLNAVIAHVCMIKMLFYICHYAKLYLQVTHDENVLQLLSPCKLCLQNVSSVVLVT